MRWALALFAMFCITEVVQAETLTFDDISAPATIPNGYGGLNWSNFFCLNTTTGFPNRDPNGYISGTVSPENVVYNGSGAEAIASGSPFTFVSAFFTGAWKNDLEITISGYLNGAQVGQFIFFVNGDYASREVFNFGVVDELTFISSGGTDAGYGNLGSQFVMDNMTISTPEPGSAMLVGMVSLGVIVRRRRR